MAMAGIVMAQVGAGMAWRANRLSLRAIGVWSNRLLLVGIVVEIAMVAVLSYVPGLNQVFHTSALDLWHWCFLLGWPFVVVGVEEVWKAYARRGAR